MNTGVVCSMHCDANCYSTCLLVVLAYLRVAGSIRPRALSASAVSKQQPAAAAVLVSTAAHIHARMRARALLFNVYPTHTAVALDPIAYSETTFKSVRLVHQIDVLDRQLGLSASQLG